MQLVFPRLAAPEAGGLAAISSRLLVSEVMSRDVAFVAPSASLREFLDRVEQHEAYADVARALLAGGAAEDALVRLRQLSPDDEFFEGERDAGELLGWLADRYSLSARLIRNRRVKVGAFTARALRRRDVPEGQKARAIVECCAGLARS